jgi:hypothetical protein
MALLLALGLPSSRQTGGPVGAPGPHPALSMVYTQDLALHGSTVSASSWAAARHAATKETSAVACATRCAGLHGTDGSCNAIMFHSATGDCHLGVASLPVGGEATAYVYRIQGGAWGEWGAWGACSKKCCGGVQTRARTCQTRACDGATVEEQPCQEQDCPQDCKTVDGVGCIFPFIYGGEQYCKCSTKGWAGRAWCPTGPGCVAGNCNSLAGQGGTGSWGYCSPAPACP